MNFPLIHLEIRFEQDLVSVRHRARQISGLLGFDEIDRTRIASAVSEIARNALQHGGGGRVEFSIDHPDDQPPVLAIVVSDCGRGIADLPAVLAGQPRPGAAPALGIASARRLVDQFYIESEPGHGVIAFLGKRFPAGRPPLSRADLARLSAELVRHATHDALAEIREQNQELVRTLEELRARQEELVRLNRELEDTNRGVVALYAELDEKALHLRRADELKSRFLSNMSHEFRTPLNSILALSRILLDRVDGDLSPDQAKQVAFIQKNAQDLSDLVNDLLDLAKVEAGRITVTPAEVDVANLLAGLRGMFRPLLTGNAVTLVFEDPSGIPTMYTDEAKISQILRNFISNALKFTERGHVRVSAAYEPYDRIVTFCVADTGIGIAANDQERIFEEFTQLDSPIQKRVRGTGLGLPLARKLAEILGGSVSVRSELGVGSTFSAAIPLLYPGIHRPPSQPRPEPDITRYPVLIIDHDAEFIMLCEKYLKGAGFQVLPAADPDEARRLLGEIHPAAILLDVACPHGPIWDFLVELKRGERTASLPVYVVSRLQEADKARALGADDFHLKPLDRRWLLEKLRRVVRRTAAEKLLIIDDDEIARYVIRDLASDTRFETVEAAGGPEGLDAARRHRPNAILLDLVMPGMNGYEVLDRLRADPLTRDIPVIIVTSKSLTDDEAALLAASNVVAVLPKDSPSRQHALSRLREALARAAAWRPALPEEAPLV